MTGKGFYYLDITLDTDKKNPEITFELTVYQKKPQTYLIYKIVDQFEKLLSLVPETFFYL